MRKLMLAIVLVLVASAPARADFGLGLFLGRPTGIDFKIGLGNRSGLDILLGIYRLDRDRDIGYGHLTYLVTPVVGQGSSVLVPIRFGVGGALYGSSGDLDFAVRVPVEIALRLRRTPLEFYGELALAATLFDPDEDAVVLDLQGGIGFRVFL
jgi:hypothetical protein